MKNRFPREFYIPKGATKVADRLSDAVAYIWTNTAGQPSALMFIGKADKPLWRFRFNTATQRERKIAAQFAATRERQARKDARRAERKAWVAPYKPGDVFRTCWGYDQTNVEYFELIEMRGKMGILRELAQSRKETGFMQGSCVPLPGEYIGEPIRRLATEYGFKIDDVRRAYPVPGEKVGGVRVIQPSSWSAYH